MNGCRLVGLGCFGSPETCERIFKKVVRHPGRMKISKSRSPGKPVQSQNKNIDLESLLGVRMRLVSFLG